MSEHEQEAYAYDLTDSAAESDSDSRQSATAYDPVRNEDVQITCHRADMPHNFDVVDAVATDDYRGGSDDDAQEHDRLLTTDLDHDPVEACQGTYSRIVEVDCPFCGYDRCTESHHTMAGVTQLTCRRCGATNHDGGNWSRPETDGQRLSKEKEWSEVAGWLGNGSMFSKGDTPLYRNNNGRHRRYWWEHNGAPRFVDPDDALERLSIMVDDNAFDAEQLGDLLTTVAEADDFDGDTLDSLDSLGLVNKLLPDSVELAMNNEEA